MMYMDQGHKLNHIEKQTCLINKNTADVTRSLQMGTETRSPWDIGFDSWIKRFEEEENKVTYLKYYKHWLYTLASTIDCSCLDYFNTKKYTLKPQLTVFSWTMAPYAQNQKK